MTNQTQITPRPQVARQAPTPQVQVAARPQQWGIAAPQGDSEVNGLIQGLSVFNPALNRLAESQAMVAHHEAKLKAEEDTTAMSAYAESVENPLEFLRGADARAPMPMPPAVPPKARAALFTQLGRRAGAQQVAEAAAEYDQHKDSQDFDLAGWLGDKRRAALAGITAPDAVAEIGKRFTEFETQVQADRRQRQYRWGDELKTSLLTQRAADVFTTNLTPDQITAAYPAFSAEAEAAGFTKRDAAGMLFQRINAMSTRLGGAPELFDVFDTKDPEGLTLAARNPQLVGMVEQARAQAKAQREKGIDEAVQPENAQVLMQLHADLRDRPEAVTKDRMLSLMGPHGPIRTAHEAADWVNRAETAMAEKRAFQELSGAFDRGEMFRLPPATQAKVLEARLGSTVDALVGAVRSGDPQSIAEGAALLMAAHSASRATEPVQAVKQLTKTIITSTPNAEGPPPVFTAGVELFRRMSAYPQFRDLYFDENTSRILRGYLADRDAGSDERSAYAAAYRQTTPEYKAMAAEMLKRPEVQKRLAKAADETVGASWWPRLLGGNGKPGNPEEVQASVRGVVRDFLTRHPDASDEDLKEMAGSWVAKNYVLDTTTHRAIKVDPTQAGPAAQEAISAYTKALSESYSVGQRSGVPLVPTLTPKENSKGTFMVTMRQGMQVQAIGEVDLGYLMDWQRSAKVLSAQERDSIGAFRASMASGGKPDGAQVVSPALIAKAQAVGALKPEEVEAYRQQSAVRIRTGFEGAFRASLGSPSAGGVLYLPSRAGTDAGLTSDTALRFAQGSSVAGFSPGLAAPIGQATQGYMDLAASLITLGEGVRLRVHDDPAQGAGRNIGMGYNLKANAKTLADDFRRAGIPKERTDDVIEGRAELTMPQAERLLRVTLERHEKQAIQTAEAVKPGLWDSMSPQMKAVMLDVSWQVGSTDQFRKAWQAVAAGDSDALARETRVVYTDRSGTQKEATGRTTLRASMLQGLPYWLATVKRYGAVPSNRLQALAAEGQAGDR